MDNDATIADTPLIAPSERERQVLMAWAYANYDESLGMTFNDFTHFTGMESPRRYVRALARKGWLEHTYFRADDDAYLRDDRTGRLQGSGYVLSDRGVAEMTRLGWIDASE